MSGDKKATIGMVISSGGHCQSPFQQWPSPPITIPAVALNSSSNSTSAGKETCDGVLRFYLTNDGRWTNTETHWSLLPKERTRIKCHVCNILFTATRLTVADLHSKKLNAPYPPRPIFFIFKQFSGKFGRMIGWHPHFGVGIPVWEALDPPLLEDKKQKYNMCKQ